MQRDKQPHYNLCIRNMTSDEGIKLAVLEQKVTDLNAKVTDIQVDVKAIIVTLSKQPSLEAKILSLETQLMELRRGSGFMRKIELVLTSILTATLTFLIISYLTDL